MAKASKSRSEQKRICNLIPTPAESTQKDWTFGTAREAGLLSAKAAIPASVDLRRQWWNIGDQGETGSCVGWASTEGVARYMFVTAKRLAEDTRLSPRFTWMASKETDQFTSRPETMIEGAGTTLKAAVDVLRNYGAVPDALLPFVLKTAMYTGDEDAFFATAATLKVSSYFNLRRNLGNWRTWLAQHGPILVGLNVDATWDQATSTDGKLDTFQPGTERGGHAVAVVGYTSDRFILRNSWGTRWGDDGFAYASEAYINAGFFPESYGVTL
jgi:C1A family cysteine protease